MELKNNIIKFIKNKNESIKSKWKYFSNFNLGMIDFDEMWTKEYISNGVKYQKRVRFVRYSNTIQPPFVEIQISIIKKTKTRLPKWYTDSYPEKAGEYIWSVVDIDKEAPSYETHIEAFKKYIL